MAGDRPAVVEQHGGAIRAQSDGPGRGTTISIRVPVECPASAATS
jgi:signal transduction histidine kinase